MTAARIVLESAAWKGRKRAPLLSIVVPVHNTAAFVISALSSLVPTAVDEVELVIIHDGGTDNSLALAEAWVRTTPVAARLLDQPNRGLAATRMAGLEHVTAPLVSFLDSDDIADPEIRLRMARDCLENDCDIVMCRSAVLDGATFTAEPFYDAAIWDRIMGTRSFLRTTLYQEPRLLRLEPNTSQRVIRLDFFRKAGLRFPVGRKFEDFPAHVRGMIRAGAVGLRNETGYLYRVNRPGKMTDERNAARMDGIAVVGEAVAEATAVGPRPVTVWAGANLAVQATRMLYWHGGYVTNAKRAEFVEHAVAVGRTIPAEWYARAIEHYAENERERLILGAFWHGNPRVVRAFIEHRYPRPGDALAFAARPAGRGFARAVARRIATFELSWRGSRG